MYPQKAYLNALTSLNVYSPILQQFAKQQNDKITVVQTNKTPFKNDNNAYDHICKEYCNVACT